MANQTIGRVRCPFTGEWAEVRRYATGKAKLYFVSSAGMITPNLGPGQKWMEENTEFFNEAKPVNDKKPENKPEKQTAQPVKKRGFFDALLGDDDDE